MDKRLFEIINTMFEEAGRNTIDNLSLDARLREDLDMNSYALAELTVRIENEFGVDIFEDGYVYTIGDILTKIKGATE
jgi:acyl carrier protein